MTFVGPFAIVLSLCAVPFAFPGRPNRYLLGFLLLALHLSAAVFYYSYVQTHDADSVFYYFDPLRMSSGPNQFGTVFVVKLVQSLRRIFGGSYLEYFLLFQTAGLFGIVLLSRSLSHLQYKTSMPATNASVWFLFLPSVHFWTSAIGKDAPLFFACSLASWSTMNFARRWLWFAVAIAVMFPFRPHIALITLVALFLSLLFDNRFETAPRLFFLAASLVLLPFLLETAGNYLNFDASDPSSVVDFVASRQDIGGMAGGGTAVSGGFPIRLLSLLFRPFFVDTKGIFGMISSIENAIFLLSLIYFLKTYGRMRDFFQLPIYSKYCYFFTIILTFSFAAVYYNVGLGLRERVMAYPTLLPIFVVAWAFARGGEKGRPIPARGAAPPSASFDLIGEPQPGVADGTSGTPSGGAAE